MGWLGFCWVWGAQRVGRWLCLEIGSSALGELRSWGIYSLKLLTHRAEDGHKMSSQPPWSVWHGGVKGKVMLGLFLQFGITRVRKRLGTAESPFELPPPSLCSFAEPHGTKTTFGRQQSHFIPQGFMGGWDTQHSSRSGTASLPAITCCSIPLVWSPWFP